MLKALWRVFVDGLIKDDEKVASYKNKHTQYNTKVQTPNHILYQNGQHRWPICDQNG